MPHYHFDTHRRALGLLGSFVVILAVGGVVAGGVGLQHALRRAVQRRDGRLAAKSVAEMSVPADYVQFTAGCGYYRCYRVRRASTSVAADAKALLESAHVARQPDPGHLVDECDREMFVASECVESGFVHHRRVAVIVRTRHLGTEVDVEFTQAVAG